MTEILEQLGSVLPIPAASLGQLRARVLSPTPLDVVFVSWLENRMLDATGRISWLRVARVVLRTLGLRASTRKLVMIRHNHLPHATVLKDRPRAQQLVNLYEKWLFDGALTHSPLEATLTRRYCPHPLYRVAPATRDEPQQLPELRAGEYFVVFGRIEPYKQLEELMRVFPRQRALVICGRCSDDAYLGELTRSAPDNVHILQEPLTDAQAQALIQRSCGLVISHASSDMIVSASFFYAMSVGQRVYAVATPFLEWASAELGKDSVILEPTIEQLCLALSAVATEARPQPEVAHAVQRQFGDQAVARQLAQCLESLGVFIRTEAAQHAAPMAPHSGDDYARS